MSTLKSVNKSETKKALTIRKPGDRKKITQVRVVIVGMPSCGKTTLGNSAGSPENNGEDILLIDLDSGSHRAKNFKDTFDQIACWEDVAAITPEFLAPYKYIVVDTAGAALDFIAADLINNDKYNLHSQKDGTLSLKGYGAAKAAFSAWEKRIWALGKSLIFLCHDKEVGPEDKKYIRAEIMGGSYNELMRKADAVGYYYFEETKDRGIVRVLDFNPCKQWIGKNPGEFPPMEVPSYIEDPYFLNKLINEMIDKLNNKTEESIEEEAKISELQSKIRAAAGLDDVKAIHAEIKSSDLATILRKQIFATLQQKAATLDIKYNLPEKIFYSEQPQAPAVPETKSEPEVPAETTPPVQQPTADVKTPEPDPAPDVKPEPPAAENATPKVPDVKEEDFDF